MGYTPVEGWKTDWLKHCSSDINSSTENKYNCSNNSFSVNVTLIITSMSCQKNLHCLQICFNICELLIFKIFIWPIIILLSVYVDSVIIGRISFNKDIKMFVYIMLQQILEHGKNKQ